MKSGMEKIGKKVLNGKKGDDVKRGSIDFWKFSEKICIVCFIYKSIVINHAL